MTQSQDDARARIEEARADAEDVIKTARAGAKVEVEVDRRKAAELVIETARIRATTLLVDPATYSALTGDQADRNSLLRAQRNLRANRVVAAFALAAFLILAILLQQQQVRLREYQLSQCQQRSVNAQKSIAYYDMLIDIENRTANTPAVRADHIRAFNMAKPNLPVC